MAISRTDSTTFMDSIQSKDGKFIDLAQSAKLIVKNGTTDTYPVLNDELNWQLEPCKGYRDYVQLNEKKLHTDLAELGDIREVIININWLYKHYRQFLGMKPFNAITLLNASINAYDSDRDFFNNTIKLTADIKLAIDEFTFRLERYNEKVRAVKD